MSLKGKIMRRSLLIAALALLTGCTVQAANEVHCKCNDGSVKAPYCDICGSDAGWMEKTKEGADCFCDNGLKSKTVSCVDVCRLNQGWSGEVR